MGEVTQEQREAEDRDWTLASATVENYVCGECDGRLVLVRWEDRWAAKCAQVRAHEGYREIPTATELYRAGEPVPPYVSTALDRTKPQVQSVELMAKIWQDRSRALTRAGATVAALYSLALGVDPRFGEIACLEFGQGNTKAPTVMITEKGWKTLASRECPDIFDRTPVLNDVWDPEIKARYKAKPQDFVCLARGTLKGDDPRLGIREAVGIYTERQWQRDQGRKGPGGDPLPAAEMPQNQARARASRHWYEQNTPQAVERARSEWGEAQKSLDVEGAEKIIEAEWHWADEEHEGERPQPRAQGPGRSPSYSREGPPAATANQKNAILGLGMSLFGWDQQDIEREVGSALDALNVGQAGEIITEWQKRQEKEAEERQQAGL